MAVSIHGSAGGAPVEDIISQGQERPPGLSRRRKLLIAAAVLIVAALAVAEHLPHNGARAHHVSTGGVQYGGGEAIIKLRAEAPTGPSGILGVHVKVPEGIRLPRTGAQPAWYWPGPGSARPIGGLPYDRFGYVFTRVGGGWAIQPDPVGPAGCDNCPGPPVPVYYLGNQSPSAVRLGSGTMAAPGASAGLVWLTSFAAGRELGTRPGLAREYTDIAPGEALGRAVSLPYGYTIGEGTPRGLLLVPITEQTSGDADILWNPASHRVLRSFEGVIALSPGQVAMTPPCTATCPVHVYNLTTGRTNVLRLPSGDTATDGDFSPDGRFLALQVSVGDDGDDGALALQLEVADTTSARLAVVPHTWVSSDALEGFGWPGNGDTLAAELTFATRVQVAVWNPARHRLSVADVRSRDYPAALVLG